MPSKNILTGVRSNGIPTLGNYLGAILPMVETQNSLQKDDSLFIFLPDLQAELILSEKMSIYTDKVMFQPIQNSLGF
jgi:tryptophanyl-tRNA synthetase